MGGELSEVQYFALSGVRVCVSAFKCPMPWTLFTGRRGDSDSRCSKAPDASLTHPVSSMRGLQRRASGDMGEFTNPRERS